MTQFVAAQFLEVSDVEFVSRYLAGDELAFRAIVHRYHAMVFNVALRIVGCREDAEDAAQDAFMSLALELGRFEGRSSLKTWIYRVAANAALMIVRTRKKHRQAVSTEWSGEDDGVDLLSRLPAPRSDADADVLSAESWTILERRIDALPETFRTVVVLADLEELSNLEIAEVLGLSVPAVKSRLHRARLSLRRDLAEHFDRAPASRSRARDRFARAAADLAALTPEPVPA
jgi:RNA polymerase sigma-70 factor (ECF subfamily)